MFEWQKRFPRKEKIISSFCVCCGWKEGKKEQELEKSWRKERETKRTKDNNYKTQKKRATERKKETRRGKKTDRKKERKKENNRTEKNNNFWQLFSPSVRTNKQQRGGTLKPNKLRSEQRVEPESNS